MITKRGRYGVALTFEAPVLKTDGSYAVIGTDWTPAAGDVKVSKDGGNVANITTLPTLLGGTGSKQGVWSLSATEMEATRILVQISDAALQDDTFIIETLPESAIYVGKASAGGANTITLATGLAIVPGALVHIHGNTGAGQMLVVNAYVTGTGVVTMENSWTTQPDSTSLVTVYPGPVAPATNFPGVNIKQVDDDATAAANLEAALDGTGYNVGAGQVVAASVTGAVGSVTGDVGGNVTGSVGSLAAQAKTDVNAEVNDVLNVDAQAELAAVPAANASLGTKIRYMFARLRNKSTFNKDTGAWALRNDADGGNIATRTDSNDGTTYTKAEDA